MKHTRRLEEGGGMQHFRDALARVLRERVEFPPGTMVTVLDAKVTKATTHAKAVITIFPTSSEAEAMKILENSAHNIKDGLADELRLRRIPTLHWSLDTSGEVAARIDRTIEELKQKGDL